MYQNKEKAKEQFGKMKNHNVSRNRKLFWKEMAKVNYGKLQENKS